MSLGKAIAKGANAVVYSASLKVGDGESMSKEKNTENPQNEDHPLAVKMMFNYDIQSNAMAILRAMYRETVPARQYYTNIEIADWEKE